MKEIIQDPMMSKKINKKMQIILSVGSAFKPNGSLKASLRREIRMFGRKDGTATITISFTYKRRFYSFMLKPSILSNIKPKTAT